MFVVELGKHMGRRKAWAYSWMPGRQCIEAGTDSVRHRARSHFQPVAPGMGQVSQDRKSERNIRLWEC